jgi:hypothetical protein
MMSGTAAEVCAQRDTSRENGRFSHDSVHEGTCNDDILAARVRPDHARRVSTVEIIMRARRHHGRQTFRR